MADQAERVTDRPKTIWTSSKPRKTLTTHNMPMVVPSCIPAVPSKDLIDKPLIVSESSPLDLDPTSERLRAYHTRLDLMQAIINPDQADLEWQVEDITEHTTKSGKKGPKTMLKVTWIGGDKQWVDMEDMRLHDPYLVIKYALKTQLMDRPG